MKKIYFTLIVLLLAMVGMAYLYFSRLNRESAYNEVSLYAATANSGLVFCVHNDKSVFDILKGQTLFQQLTGASRFSQFNLLRDRIISNPPINKLIANRNIFISFSPGKDKTIDYLISTQLNGEQNKALLLNALRSGGIKTSDDNGLIRLTLADSLSFYLGLKKNLVLLSGTAATVRAAMAVTTPSKTTSEFIDYIKLNNKRNQNSVGNLFIDFNKIPALIRSVLPGPLNGNLAMFEHQDSFAALNYNFNRERLFFNGNTKLNAADNYLNLFSGQVPQKNSLDNLLPQNTANYRLFSIPDYKTWRKSLNNWFKQHREDQEVRKTIDRTDQLYHLRTEEIFPGYFKDQLISFQLKSAENIGAINLTNGDKVSQLLIDISEDYDQDIKKFKLSGLLYAYFGEPFKKFSSPYYTIIDNYLVFSNQPHALQTFLLAYRNNHLLINTPDYISLYTQISNSAGITFYVNHDNSSDLIRNTVYTPYYRHFSADKGLGKFSSMIWQLNGDKGLYQTNLLINTAAELRKENVTDTLLASPLKP